MLLRNMYVCDRCKRLTPPHTALTRVVVSYCDVTYPFRGKANHFHRKHKHEYRDDNGGTGREIMRELRVCPSCAS